MFLRLRHSHHQNAIVHCGLDGFWAKHQAITDIPNIDVVREPTEIATVNVVRVLVTGVLLCCKIANAIDCEPTHVLCLHMAAFAYVFGLRTATTNRQSAVFEVHGEIIHADSWERNMKFGRVAHVFHVHWWGPAGFSRKLVGNFSVVVIEPALQIRWSSREVHEVPCLSNNEFSPTYRGGGG